MMKGRVFGMLLSLCLAIMLNPAAALGEEEIPLTVPYTLNVVKGGSAEPGNTYFYLEMIDNTGAAGSNHADVNISCPAVPTDGVGSYPGEVIMTGTLEGLSMLADGVFLRQCDRGEDGWAYDPAVWCVKIVPVAARAVATPVDYVVYPAKYDSKSGKYIPDEKNPQRAMAFTNIYGGGAVAPAPDTTKLPKTSDSSSLPLWLALLAVSAAGVTACCRRRRNARE